MAKAIIFGGNGQDGYYLENALIERGVEVLTTARTSSQINIDVAEYAQVNNIVKYVQPQFIFQLAASSTTAHAGLFDNHNAIATGGLNVLESAWQHCRGCKVFLPGSGVQFKNRGLPINESEKFCALDPYSVARIQSVYAARYYREKGLRTYVGYLFHHESPRRSLNHISQQVVHCVQNVLQRGCGHLEIGDLYVEKEWTHAQDVVDGMITLMNQDDEFECVIGSGEAYQIKDWIELCFGLAELDWTQHIQPVAKYTAPFRRLVSDPARMSALGWSPKVNFEMLGSLMMESIRTDTVRGHV